MKTKHLQKSLRTKQCKPNISILSELCESGLKKYYVRFKLEQQNFSFFFCGKYKSKIQLTLPDVIFQLQQTSQSGQLFFRFFYHHVRNVVGRADVGRLLVPVEQILVFSDRSFQRTPLLRSVRKSSRNLTKDGRNDQTVFSIANLLLRRPDLRQKDGSTVAVGVPERLALKVDVDSPGYRVSYHQLRRDLKKKRFKIKFQISVKKRTFKTLMGL